MPRCLATRRLNAFEFLLVVLSLAAGSLPPRPDVQPVVAVPATLALMLGWGILSAISARQTRRAAESRTFDSQVAWEHFTRQMHGYRWIGLAWIGVAHVAFGWGALIGELRILQVSMFAQACWLLLPAVLLSMGLWNAEASAIAFGEPTAGGNDRKTGHGFAVGLITRCKELSSRFRGSLAWLVLPIVALMGIADAARLLPIPTESLQHGLPLLAIVLVVIGLPLAMRMIFTTTTMRQSDGEWLSELTRRAGLANLRLRRWDTGLRTHNALVAGFVPPVRTLMVSDRILAELPAAQIAMVVLHEIAHLKRRHLPLRMVAMVPAWAAGYATTRAMGESPWAEGLGLFVGLLLTMSILAVVSHWSEHDADVHACLIAERLGGQVKHVPETREQAAAALSAALRRVTWEHSSLQKSTWLHPSVARRTRRLFDRCGADLATDPGYFTDSKSSKSSRSSSMSSSSSSESPERPNSALISSSISIS